jgi:hypothetical protein
MQGQFESRNQATICLISEWHCSLPSLSFLSNIFPQRLDSSTAASYSDSPGFKPQRGDLVP